MSIMKKELGGIYAIIAVTDEGNDDLYYVGSVNQNTGFKKRWSNHLTKLRKKTHTYPQLTEAFHKGNVRFEILIQCADELLEDLERFYTKKFFKNMDGVKVINKTNRFKRVNKYNKETIKKLREKQKWENNGNNRLTEQQAAEIKWLALYSNYKQREIAKKYGLNSTGFVSEIKNNKKWVGLKPRKPDWIV